MEPISSAVIAFSSLRQICLSKMSLNTSNKELKYFFFYSEQMRIISINFDYLALVSLSHLFDCFDYLALVLANTEVKDYSDSQWLSVIF